MMTETGMRYRPQLRVSETTVHDNRDMHEMLARKEKQWDGSEVKK